MTVLREMLLEREQYYLDMLEALPVAIYTTDAAGKITYYHQAAADFAGRRPKLGSDQWCVTWRLFWPDGTPMPHAECPMAVTLKEGWPIRGQEAIAERPDGMRVPFVTKGGEAERQPDKTAERQAKQQPRRDRGQQPPKHNGR